MSSRMGGGLSMARLSVEKPRLQIDSEFPCHGQIHEAGGSQRYLRRLGHAEFSPYGYQRVY